MHLADHPLLAQWTGAGAAPVEQMLGNDANHLTATGNNRPRHRAGGIVCHREAVGAGGVLVSWAVHDLLALDPAREAAGEATREIMNMALAEMLFALGYAIQPFGTSGVWMATGRRAEQQA